MAKSYFSRPRVKPIVQSIQAAKRARMQQESVGSGGRRRERAIDRAVDEMVNGVPVTRRD